jgi:hypothetical protein
LIASSTATVRDGSAPAAPVRNAGAAPTAVVREAAVLVAAVDIMYRISYMTGLSLGRDVLGVNRAALASEAAALLGRKSLSTDSFG